MRLSLSGRSNQGGVSRLEALQRQALLELSCATASADQILPTFASRVSARAPGESQIHCLTGYLGHYAIKPCRHPTGGLVARATILC